MRKLNPRAILNFMCLQCLGLRVEGGGFGVEGVGFSVQDCSFRILAYCGGRGYCCKATGKLAAASVETQSKTRMLL